MARMQGFRLGVYVFKDAEVVDYAAPFGVFSVAKRFDPELDVFLISESMRPVQTQAGFTVLPNEAVKKLIVATNHGPRFFTANRYAFISINSSA